MENSKWGHIAVDLGAGSGRVMVGQLSDTGYIRMREVHRFVNRQVKLGNYLYWDFPALFAEIIEGMKKVVLSGYQIKSIGIDTWGVDFGLIDNHGRLLGNPVSYRDHRTDGLSKKMEMQLDAEKHYSESGTQIMDINTLYQLISMKNNHDASLQIADKLLFMPDLFSYYLTGVANNEYSIASTSELLNATTRQWNWDLIDNLGLSRSLFGDIIMPGTIRGKILPAIAEATGLSPDTDVIAVGSHDTASAVLAAPLSKHTAFLSSGTWSLLGTVVDEPILTDEARLAGFTNEGSADGRITFLQNITGLWILQRLTNEWNLSNNYTYLITEAESVVFKGRINVDDPIFVNPSSMEEAIMQYCKDNDQIIPSTRGEIVRCVLESLAERYAKGIEEMNALLEEPIDSLCIIGGGNQNLLLNRLTADATGIPVTCGPVEATAEGNVHCQMSKYLD